MQSPTTLSDAEYKEMVLQRFSKIVGYKFFLFDGHLGFALKKQNVKTNKDYSITWQVKAEVIGLHTFIHIITGEGEQEKTATIPMCCATKEGRKAFEVMVQSMQWTGVENTTIYLARTGKKLHDNIHEAQVCKLWFDGTVILQLYFMAKMAPKEVIESFKEPVDCKFCELEGGE